MKTEQSPRPNARWVLPFLGLSTFLTAIGNIGLVSVMPTIGRLIGIPDHLVASIFSLSALIWAISTPFWAGPVSRRGSAMFIRAGLCGFTLSMGGCALAVELGLTRTVTALQCFAMFIVLRSIFGLLGSASAIATQTLVAHRTEGQGRTAALTTLAGALSLGTIVGPAIGPLLMAAPLGPLGPMAFFAALGTIAWAGSYLLVPQDHSVGLSDMAGTDRGQHWRTLMATWRKAGIARPLVFGLLLCSAQAIILYTIGFVLIDRNGGGPLAAQGLVGETMAAGALAALLAQWGLPRIVRLSPRAMMTGGAALALAGNAVALALPTVSGAVIGFIAISFGNGLARPGFSAAASLAGTHEDQVGVATAVTFIAGASIAVPPVIAAAAYPYWQPAPDAIAVVLVLTALIVTRPIVHTQR